MTGETARPLPPIDGLTARWWDATREQRLLLQQCATCGNVQHYPRALCLACRSVDLAWLESAGAGTVHSFTVVHRAPHPALTPPYVVALVRLDDGPTLMTNIVGDDRLAVSCDERVSLTWEPLSDGRHLPVFTRSSDGL